MGKFSKSLFILHNCFVNFLRASSIFLFQLRFFFIGSKSQSKAFEEFCWGVNFFDISAMKISSCFVFKTLTKEKHGLIFEE